MSSKPPHSVGCGYSTVRACMDFETYSEAGYLLNQSTLKWSSLTNAPKRGLSSIGASVYSEHESTEVLSLAYDLNDGNGCHVWHAQLNSEPTKLFDFLSNGGLIEAWNSLFEWYIWNNVCHKRMGWPQLPLHQLRCAMAKSHAYGLPGGLKESGNALCLDIQKDTEGKKLLNKFSKPKNATKNNRNLRISLQDDKEDAQKLFKYNTRDIQAQAAISYVIPDLTGSELDLWKLDQVINTRGVYIDLESLEHFKIIIQEATTKYTQELYDLTDGYVDTVNKIQKIKQWLSDSQGVELDSLDADTVKYSLKNDNLPKDARRVLEIRSILSSASVKKTYAIDRCLSKDNRLRNLFVYCGASRTGRFSGRGAQPQNLPSAGPKVTLCVNKNCNKYYGINNKKSCPWCTKKQTIKQVPWCIDAVEHVLLIISMRHLETLEKFYGDPMLCVSGCLRGLFCAPPGKDLICSDYSAIEAVVLAQISGEQWRIDVFKTHGKIYEMSAASITGIPFDDFLQHKIKTGNHHPLRKKVGKVAELASGYGGGLVAWLRFGADEYFKSDEEIKNAVQKWRKASPMIVNLWYKLEAAAKDAVKYPGSTFSYRDITFLVIDDVLFCGLPSGSKLAYHQPRLVPEQTPWGKDTLKLTYMGENKDINKGRKGWIRISTWGGKITENICQRVARDILKEAMLNIEGDTYQIALHVHDELAAYVDVHKGSIQEFEQIMSTMPQWCADWPIKASGGWRDKRYRKD